MVISLPLWGKALACHQSNVLALAPHSIKLLSKCYSISPVQCWHFWAALEVISLCRDKVCHPPILPSCSTHWPHVHWQASATIIRRLLSISRHLVNLTITNPTYRGLRRKISWSFTLNQKERWNINVEINKWDYWSPITCSVFIMIFLSPSSQICAVISVVGSQFSGAWEPIQKGGLSLPLFSWSKLASVVCITLLEELMWCSSCYAHSNGILAPWGISVWENGIGRGLSSLTRIPWLWFEMAITSLWVEL